MVNKFDEMLDRAWELRWDHMVKNARMDDVVFVMHSRDYLYLVLRIHTLRMTGDNPVNTDLQNDGWRPTLHGIPLYRLMHGVNLGEIKLMKTEDAAALWGENKQDYWGGQKGV